MNATENVVGLDEALEMREQGAVIGVSFGAGTDSMAMLIGLRDCGVRPDFVLFADTGGEKPETYALLDTAQGWLASQGFPALVIVRRPPSTGKAGPYTTLEAQCLSTMQLPSLAYGGLKSCSVKWKAEAMERWERAHIPMPQRGQGDLLAPKRALHDGLIIKLIGYDAGPKDSRRGVDARPFDGRYLYAYPLRQWGWDRERCKAMIRDEGLPDFGKSACFFCPANQAEEVRTLARRHPDLARRIIQMEAAAAPNLKSIGGLWTKERKGLRGGDARPASISEFLVGEELLPEFVGQTWIVPWWRSPSALSHNPNPPDTAVRAQRLLRPIEEPSHARCA